MILAIRTAKWKPPLDPLLSNQAMNDEIQFSINLTHRVFLVLIAKYESIFPKKKEPRYQPNDEDVRE